MDKEKTSDGTLETWTIEEVADAFTADEIVLIDVRTPQEYLLENIPGSMLLPMAVFEPARLPADRDKPVVLFCGSSKRSEKLARKMLEDGRKTARHMEGGFAKWKDAKQQYQTIDLPTGETTLENSS